MSACSDATQVAPTGNAGAGAGGTGGASGSGTAGAPGQDAGTADETAPTLRDVRVDVEGALAASFDVDTRDESYVLAVPSTALFTVFARDDETDAERLAVEIVDADGVRLPTEPPTFDAGLWRMRIAIDRGMQLRTRVRDAAGNQVVSEGSLLLPTAEEALVGDWQKRLFDAFQVVSSRWDSTWTEADWRETRDDSGLELRGSFAIEGDTLTLAERFRSGGTADDLDESTIEVERRARFHIDELFFSDRPLFRTGAGTDIEGTWERTEELRVPRSGTLEVAETATITLELESSGTWTETRIGTATDATGTQSDIDETVAGTYTTELASSYTAGASFFLSRTVTSRNGSPVAGEPDQFDIFIIRVDRLLIRPWQR